MIEINLALTKGILSGRQAAFQRGFFWVLGVALVIFLLDLAGFFLIRGVLDQQARALSREHADLLSQADQFLTVATDLRTIEEKTAGVVVVRSVRRDMAAMISETRRFFVPGMELVNLDVDASGTVAFSAKAADVESLGKFIAQISQAQKDSRLEKIILRGLRSDLGAGFSFQVSAVYQPQKGTK